MILTDFRRVSEKALISSDVGWDICWSLSAKFMWWDGIRESLVSAVNIAKRGKFPSAINNTLPTLNILSSHLTFIRFSAGNKKASTMLTITVHFTDETDKDMWDTFSSLNVCPIQIFMCEGEKLLQIKWMPALCKFPHIYMIVGDQLKNDSEQSFLK